MDKTIKITIFVLVLMILGGIILFGSPFMKSPPGPSGNEVSDAGKITVFFFYGEECPHCHNVMPFIRNLSAKYPEVDLRMLETWHNETNLALSNSLNQKLDIQSPGVPEVIVGNNALIGDKDIPARLEGLILDEIKKNQ